MSALFFLQTYKTFEINDTKLDHQRKGIPVVKKNNTCLYVSQQCSRSLSTMLLSSFVGICLQGNLSNCGDYQDSAHANGCICSLCRHEGRPGHSSPHLVQIRPKIYHIKQAKTRCKIYINYPILIRNILTVITCY